MNSLEDNRIVLPWNGQNAQVGTESLKVDLLQVYPMEATATDPALVILMTKMMPGTSYRWQKASAKEVPGGNPILLWMDCITVPDSVSYLVYGSELHAGDVYRCVQYVGGEPQKASYYTVTWEDEKRYRPILWQELSRLGSHAADSEKVMADMHTYLMQIKAENEELQNKLNTAQIELANLDPNKDNSRVEQARKWARAWEKRARKAERQLNELRNQLKINDGKEPEVVSAPESDPPKTEET